MTRPLVVFAGDSVTDCGRREDALGLGDGYVRMIADAHPDIDVVNAGVSGDRVRDLRRRWDADVLAERPALVSVLVGINDTWRRYDSADPTDADAFERDYRALLEPLSDAGTALVLIEPFLLPANAEQVRWREDLDPKIDVVRRLAGEFDAILVPTGGPLTSRGAALALAPDGVHPSEAGHRALAALWSAHAAPVLDVLAAADDGSGG